MPYCPSRNVMRRPTCIDLFCGCGGFTLGMVRAGLNVVAAIDFDEHAMLVFRKNFPSVGQALQTDLTRFPPEKLAELLDTVEVDLIVGGPPCQGFSTVRQRDGANHGPRLVKDPRRSLYREFLKYVDFFQPRLFVMENVPGIRSAAGGAFFCQVQDEARSAGYRVHSQIEKAISLGVPQKRRRQLIIGTRLDVPDFFAGELTPVSRAVISPTLGEAIGDLPPVRAGGGMEHAEYDMERRKAHVQRYGRGYLYGTLEVQHASGLTAHRARPHSDRDLRDFARLREGEHCAEAMKRGEIFEFPYDRMNFKDRYTRQHRNKPCSTIVAHMSKDGLMFIHPTQNRSLTPREAARIQSFPDWFEFPIARTHQFRVIGNAVPPLVAEAVGLAAVDYLERAMKRETPMHFGLKPLPCSQMEAIQWLEPVVRSADNGTLRKLPAVAFRKGWYSIGFLFAGLHPDSALEHGTELSTDAEDIPGISRVEPRLLAPFFVQSGWPVVLAPIASEAWRRYKAKELSDEEFYCSEAVIAGMCCRNTRLKKKAKRERANALA